jgi:hypothetical protein
MSAHLWLAKTPFDFMTAWRERNHFVIVNDFDLTGSRYARDFDRFPNSVSCCTWRNNADTLKHYDGNK